MERIQLRNKRTSETIVISDVDLPLYDKSKWEVKKDERQILCVMRLESGYAPVYSLNQFSRAGINYEESTDKVAASLKRELELQASRIFSKQTPQPVMTSHMEDED